MQNRSHLIRLNGRKVSWRQPGESHLVSEAAGASVVANRTEHRLWVLEMAVGKKVRDLAAAAHSPGSLICIKAESRLSSLPQWMGG